MKKLIKELTPKKVTLYKKDKIFPYEHIITNEPMSSVIILCYSLKNSKKAEIEYIKTLFKKEIKTITIEKEDWNGYPLFKIEYENENYFVSVDEEFGTFISKQYD